jgi:hypothetical protein
MIEISLVELQLHVAAALALLGVGADAFEVLLDGEGGWRIRITAPAPNTVSRDNYDAARAVEAALGRRYRIHRLSRGAAYGG